MGILGLNEKSTGLTRRGLPRKYSRDLTINEEQEQTRDRKQVAKLKSLFAIKKVKKKPQVKKGNLPRKKEFCRQTMRLDRKVCVNASSMPARNHSGHKKRFKQRTKQKKVDKTKKMQDESLFDQLTSIRKGNVEFGEVAKRVP